jgi:hypothetical protein
VRVKALEGCDKVLQVGVSNICIALKCAQFHQTFSVDLTQNDPALWVLLGLDMSGRNKSKPWYTTLQGRWEGEADGRWRTVKPSNFKQIGDRTLQQLQLRIQVVKDGNTLATVIFEHHPGIRCVNLNTEVEQLHADMQSTLADVGIIDFSQWSEQPSLKNVMEWERDALPVVPAFLTGSDVSDTNHATNTQLRQATEALEEQKRSTTAVAAVLEASRICVKRQEAELREARSKLAAAEEAERASTLKASSAAASAAGSERAASAAAVVLLATQKAQQASLREVEELSLKYKDSQLNLQEVMQNLDSSRLDEERLQLDHRHRRELYADDIARLQANLREASKQSAAQQATHDRGVRVQNRINTLAESVRVCLQSHLARENIQMHELTNHCVKHLATRKTEDKQVVLINNFFDRSDLQELRALGTLVCVNL